MDPSHNTLSITEVYIIEVCIIELKFSRSLVVVTVCNILLLNQPRPSYS